MRQMRFDQHQLEHVDHGPLHLQTEAGGASSISMFRVLEDRAGRLRDVPGRHKCGHAAQLTLWLKPTGGGEIWHKTRMNQLMDNCDHEELAELIDPPVIIGAVLYIAAMVCLTLVLSALGS